MEELLRQLPDDINARIFRFTSHPLADIVRDYIEDYRTHRRRLNSMRYNKYQVDIYTFHLHFFGSTGLVSSGDRRRRHDVRHSCYYEQWGEFFNLSFAIT